MLEIKPEQLAAADADARLAFGRTVMDELVEETIPFRGLSRTEIYGRFITGMRQAELLGLDAAADLRSFIRLSFVVGPLFSDHPRVRHILLNTRELPHGRIGILFEELSDQDWRDAAEYDIVTRAARPDRLGRRAYQSEPAATDKTMRAPVPVTLTPLREEHATAYVRHLHHPDVWRLGRLAVPPDLNEAIEQIDKACSGYLGAHAITSLAGEFLGAIVSRDESDGTAMHLWVARPYWGQGVAGAAMAQFTKLARKNRSVATLKASVSPGNPFSTALFKRGGWRHLPRGGQPASTRSGDAYRLDVRGLLQWR